MTLWLHVRDGAFYKRRPTAKVPVRRLNLDLQPSPTVAAVGIRTGMIEQHWIEETDDVTAPEPAHDKPPYRVPLMSEIAALPWNGLTVVSTFAGCGGSSTGYRMAGFRVLWASEFIDAARDVYALNAREGTLLDGRDIRNVKPEEILAATGLAVGELDVLDGSPPCASFSTAGRRQAKWGKVSKYSDKEQRSDDLFFEFARILKGLQPRVFVAENVSGLVKGTAKGYFIEILRALKACGYRVEAKLLDAQWLGVPQQRQRLIFVGVRDDIGVAPAHPRPLPYRYSVREALPHIGTVVHDTSGLYGAGDVTYRPSPAVTVGVNSVNSNHFKVSDGVVGIGTSRGIASADEPAPTVLTHGRQATQSELTVVERVIGIEEADGFHDHRLQSADAPSPPILAQRAVRIGVERVQSGERIGKRDTVDGNVGASLDGYAVGEEYDKLRPGEQSERFFSLVRPHPDQPSPTVTAAGGGGGDSGVPGSTASVVHPVERRKFTIDELKRICAFPDDFKLSGTYAQQWERLGRAVPPVMMAAIATTLRDEVFAKMPKP